ncbi:MAG: hypothetical protein ACI8RZ_005869 [Myxococcota bacterium]
MIVSVGAIATPSGEGQLGLAAEAPLSDALAVRLQSGLMMGGGIKLQDIQLTAPILLLNKGSWTGRLTPGFTLPLGSTAPALGISPAATGSVDPLLSAQIVGGSAWVVSGRISARMPLVPGLDDARQGLSGAAEISGARRLDRGAVWVGSSLVQQYPGETTLELNEVAGVAGALWNVGKQTALAVRVRVPVWSPNIAYPIAVGLEVRQVLGKRPEAAH